MKVLGSNLCESYTDIINTIAREAPANANYLNNLLICVYLMTPNPSIDYPSCFQATIKIPKLYKLICFIMEKMIKSKEFSSLIPTDEVFWEKLLVTPQDDEIFKRLLHVASQLTINRDLMWRVLSGSLDAECSMAVQSESLAILYEIIMSVEREHDIIDKL